MGTVSAEGGFAYGEKRRLTMAKLKKEEKLVCVPCGREVTISNIGISDTTILCCGRPMKHKAKVKKQNKRS